MEQKQTVMEVQTKKMRQVQADTERNANSHSFLIHNHALTREEVKDFRKRAEVIDDVFTNALQIPKHKQPEVASSRPAPQKKPPPEGTTPQPGFRRMPSSSQAQAQARAEEKVPPIIVSKSTFTRIWFNSVIRVCINAQWGFSVEVKLSIIVAGATPCKILMFSRLLIEALGPRVYCITI